MSHEHELLSADEVSRADQASLAGVESEPAFLTRARRILMGEIRPEDYLPEPAEVIQAVAVELQRIVEDDGVEATHAAKRRLLNDWTLHHHHRNDSLLARYTDRGVIVLAAGKEQIYEVRQRLNPDSHHEFVLIFPSAV